VLKVGRCSLTPDSPSLISAFTFLLTFIDAQGTHTVSVDQPPPSAVSSEQTLGLSDSEVTI
jgi:hypothetical protein